MKFGNLQCKWQEKEPAIYDKETRVVCMNIKQETRQVTEGDKTEERQGYSFIQVQIDNLIDYGHIKSQLIEAGFAQKDEFGLVINATDVLINAILTAESHAEVKEILKSDEDVADFVDFCEFRKMCADTAKEVLKYY